jgi:hypothetical protein
VRFQASLIRKFRLAHWATQCDEIMHRILSFCAIENGSPFIVALVTHWQKFSETLLPLNCRINHGVSGVFAKAASPVINNSAHFEITLGADVPVPTRVHSSDVISTGTQTTHMKRNPSRRFNGWNASRRSTRAQRSLRVWLLLLLLLGRLLLLTFLHFLLRLHRFRLML